MKIGFVLDDGLDKPDGVQQYILTLGHWLKSEGHIVHYLVGETHRTDIRNVHSLSKNRRVTFNGNQVSIPYSLDKTLLRNILKKEKFDVLHVQMPYSPILGAKAIKYAPELTGIVGTFHIVPFSFREKLATRALRLLIRRSLKKIDIVLSVSRPAARFAKKSLGKKSVVVPNVIQTNLFSSGKKITKYQDTKINIVFLGRLVPRKGCMELLKTIDKLHQDRVLTNVRVLICGKGPQENELKKYVHQRRLGAIVTFVGFLTEVEKPNYLASANIAVFPSLGGESFGIVLLEAMSSGSEVVVAGNNSGYRSVLGKLPSQLVSPGDTKQFSKTLKHYIINAKARQYSKRQQAKLVAGYDVHNVGKQIVAKYKSAIAKHEQ